MHLFGIATIVSGGLLVGSKHSQVAAQFQEHHQQYIDTFEYYKTSDTKA